MKLPLLALAAFGAGLASAKIDPNNRCDDSFFYRSIGEINRDCVSDCYQDTCNPGKVPGDTLGDNTRGAKMSCYDDCTASCNRCDPDVYDEVREYTPYCPEPDCLKENLKRDNCIDNCGGLSRATQKGLAARYKKLGLSTGVVGGDDICKIFCNCKVTGPSSFPWNGEALCNNLKPLPRSRRLRQVADLWDEEEM